MRGGEATRAWVRGRNSKGRESSDSPAPPLPPPPYQKLTSASRYESTHAFARDVVSAMVDQRARAEQRGGPVGGFFRGRRVESLSFRESTFQTRPLLALLELPAGARRRQAVAVLLQELEARVGECHEEGERIAARAAVGREMSAFRRSRARVGHSTTRESVCAWCVELMCVRTRRSVERKLGFCGVKWGGEARAVASL